MHRKRPIVRTALWILSQLTGFFGLPLVCHGQPYSPVLSLYEQRTDKVVLQQYDLSCGAAALATLLRYQHGAAIDEHQVALGLISRDIYITDPGILRRRQGFSLQDMHRFVEQIGYKGVALGDVSLDDLKRRAPAIVPIQLQGYSHFVVFRGELKDTVLLADPAFGNRTLSVDQFLASWIRYAEFGRVAFAVQRRDGLIPPNQLQPSVEDFPMLMTAQGK